MDPRDKNYILALMRGLKLKSSRGLNAIMGANELKQVLTNATANDFMGKNPWINLHTHSNASDGALSPEQWLDNALSWKKEHHLQTYIIALTDHDTLSGLVPVLRKLVKNPKRYDGLRLVLGCELSCAYEGSLLRQPLDFEILHYGVNPFDKSYINLLSKQSEIRQKQLPIIFQNLNDRYPDLPACLDDFYRSDFYGANIRKGLGVNWLYNIMSYLKSIASPNLDLASVHDYLLSFGSQSQNNHMWYSSKTLLSFIKKHGGIASMAHPYRLQLEHKLNANVEQFIPYFFDMMHHDGMEATELFYGKLRQMQSSFDAFQTGNFPQNETDHWVRLIYQTSQQIFSYATGGADNHDSYLGNAQFKEKESAWIELLTHWHKIQPLIQKGYRILGKEVTMGLPGPSMPAFDMHCDLGIGSPYGLAAQRVWHFWDKTIHKILLGPSGRTNNQSHHSPYMSDDEHPNPYFIPLEYFISRYPITLDHRPAFRLSSENETNIDFNQVEANFQYLVKTSHCSEKQIDLLATKFKNMAPYPYIADLQVYLPNKLTQTHPGLFLKDFTLGTPGDAISSQPRNWGFPVFNPKKLWASNGLGPAGKLWQHIIDQAIRGAKGGLRIDHFIGLVNPYLISQNPDIPNGRLYSSPDHPVLKDFAFTKPEQFYKIIDKIVLPVLKKHHLSIPDLYPEDIGARPLQMDDVLNHFKLGRLVVAQFRNPNDPYHMYHLMNTSSHDIATLDTHDTPSIQMFFDSLDDNTRYHYAHSLAKSLRFNYTDDLKSTQQLVRMQWGELLTCPAKRVQAFFTSWTGQIGRYNEPGNPNKWKLRCVSNFEELYFKNLNSGRAYNPLDAIALAIYARGDKTYQQNKDFVAKLREAETALYKLIQKWLCA